MLSYYLFKHSVRHFQRQFPSSTISPVFGIQNVQRMLSAPNPLEFIIFRIKTAAFGCAPVYPNGRASHEISNQKNNVSNMSDLQHFAISFIIHPWL